MPKRPPSDKTHAKGVPPMVNPHFQCGMPHAAQICETNPIYRTGTACRAPISRNEPNLHRGRPVEDQKTRNKPNLTPAAPRLCETNPIYRTPAACRAPKMRNEPNLPPQPPRQPPKMRNEPNCHPRVASRAAGCGAKRSGPKPRDLFNHHRQRRFQTNKPPSAPPIMRNEPNFRTAAPLFTIHHSLFTIFTKRTQSAPTATRPHPLYAKRTQFPTTNI